MQKLFVHNNVSLDGYFAGPNGEIDWHNFDAEMAEYSVELMQSLSAVIFGRTTYELMASHWPTSEALENDPIVAERMNNLPKIVYSKTLKEVADGPVWKNVTVLREIEPETIIKMKEQDGGDIAVGGGTIAQQFMNLDLVDEYRIVINPIVLGTGKPLFKDIRSRHNLELLSTRTFKNGNVLVRYKPV